MYSHTCIGFHVQMCYGTCSNITSELKINQNLAVTWTCMVGLTRESQFTSSSLIK